MLGRSPESPGGVVKALRSELLLRGVRATKRLVPLAGAVVLAAGLFACGDNDLTATETTASSAEPEDFVAEAADFVNINSMTPINGYFIDNRLGHLDEALEVARSDDGGTFPVGTIIQLVPQEAMVKRARGWDAATNDWEFFFLDVTADGSTIATRGADETVNRFGGNCASCHQMADPKWDFICAQDHGCEPLPIGRETIEAIQAADPRKIPKQTTDSASMTVSGSASPDEGN